MTDTLMDMVENTESLYFEKIAMFDRWVEQGDAWSVKNAMREASELATHFAEAVSGMYDMRFMDKHIKQAVHQMLTEFPRYHEYAIEKAVEFAGRPPQPEEPMDQGEIEHAAKYEALAQRLGIDRLQELIPAPPEKIRTLLERGDKHLNKIPLYKWDAVGASIVDRDLSLSDKVCALKHVAKWHYA